MLEDDLKDYWELNKNRLKSLGLATILAITIGTLKYCQSIRYKEGEIMDKKTLNELIDFADKTKQLNHIADIIKFYEVSLQQSKDERGAFRETIKTYDLSWHPEYKKVFEEYKKKREEMYKKDNENPTVF
ncbi:MAG TPA: hypothetical protein V6C58_25560 [Allocoleopsis sp.]